MVVVGRVRVSGVEDFLGEQPNVALAGEQIDVSVSEPRVAYKDDPLSVGREGGLEFVPLVT
jgi:hypothetical protein